MPTCPHMHLSREGDHYTCDDCGFELVAIKRHWGPEAPKEPESKDVPSKF